MDNEKKVDKNSLFAVVNDAMAAAEGAEAMAEGRLLQLEFFR